MIRLIKILIREWKHNPKNTSAKRRLILHGMREYRLSCTSHYDDPDINLYDCGRELAHLLTFRYFDRNL